MTATHRPRRSFWTWGLQSEEPTDSERAQHAAQLSERFGARVAAPPIPKAGDLDLRPPRITIPDGVAAYCFTDNYERALHSYSADDREPSAINGHFPNPPDAVAHPRNETELERVLEWCDSEGYVVIPFGGGSSVVGGVTPPEVDGVVTIDMDEFDRVLEIDESSRAARIQAGVFGPHLEDQLRPHGYTLRHYPQSFTGSTLGGWIATRSGGHYATNQTHIDEFVESVRMLTPSGWWESRRLPGGGAGPDPNRLAIGSEGILGIITEAWMRIQVRPRYRATAGVVFDTWEQTWDAARQIVQTKLWPANLRVLDPELAQEAAGMDGVRALLIVGFESAELPQDWNIRTAVEIARAAGGSIEDDEIMIDDGSGRPTGRSGAVGAWRNAFIDVGGGLTAGLGLVTGTVETAVTWDKWPKLDAHVRDMMGRALDEACGGGTLNCRFTHVYPDGPAPYYTYAGAYRSGDYSGQQAAIKKAASAAIIEAGGTITHHHAVGRLHRPWYDQERPDVFAEALRAAKRSLDPNGILNPGVLVDV
jgi:alkyldihydroxyacetonephosphate synthase